MTIQCRAVTPPSLTTTTSSCRPLRKSLYQGEQPGRGHADAPSDHVGIGEGLPDLLSVVREEVRVAFADVALAFCRELHLPGESESCLALHALCGSSITHDDLNVAVQDLQQREKLIERLSVVRLIKEPIELSRRRAKPTNDLSR